MNIWQEMQTIKTNTTLHQDFIGNLSFNITMLMMQFREYIVVFNKFTYTNKHLNLESMLMQCKIECFN